MKTSVIPGVKFESHPQKVVFKKLGIPQVDIARFLGKSPSWVSNYLNGYVPCNDEIEQRVNELLCYVSTEETKVTASSDKT